MFLRMLPEHTVPQVADSSLRTERKAQRTPSFHSKGRREAFRSCSPAAKPQATPPTSGREMSRASADASKLPEADVRSMRRNVGAMGVASFSPNRCPSFSLLRPAPGLALRPPRCACAIELMGGGGGAGGWCCSIRLSGGLWWFCFLGSEE